MNTIHFQKWQGAGNDFIIVDNRGNQLSSANPQLISSLCDRHFGIGADGLMLIESSEEFDFEMLYYNADGNPAEMCGNGGRCIAAMASRLGIISRQATFRAIDGPHKAEVITPEWMRLRMADVSSVSPVIIPDHKPFAGYRGIFLNTGVPHLVIFVENPGMIDVPAIGRELRFLELFKPAGTNVNFVAVNENQIEIRTYERGVEDETLACGTGNVAAALAAEWAFGAGLTDYDCFARGGQLKVTFQRAGHSHFRDVWLEGPAVMVFEGEITTRN